MNDPTYCPDSAHPRKLHGVYPRDNLQIANPWGNHEKSYGTCAYCRQPVAAATWTEDPWYLLDYIIEEEPA